MIDDSHVDSNRVDPTTSPHWSDILNIILLIFTNVNVTTKLLNISLPEILSQLFVFPFCACKFHKQTNAQETHQKQTSSQTLWTRRDGAFRYQQLFTAEPVHTWQMLTAADERLWSKFFNIFSKSRPWWRAVRITAKQLRNTGEKPAASADAASGFLLKK